jgi:alkanesulfonate monooxygenase SsuD/methylene tetrahydromethanopterin reductase-like flavin-dependent oxidoreductase (luciferase family)
VTLYGVHAGTEGSSMDDVLAFWRTVESLGFGWISAWDHFYPIMGGGGAGSFESLASHAALAMATSRVRIGVLAYVLERACEAVGRDPASIRRSAHVAVVRDEGELRERAGGYDYTVTDGAVAFGSDDRVLERIKAFEAAGADQILFAGAIREATERRERVAALLGL